MKVEVKVQGIREDEGGDGRLYKDLYCADATSIVDAIAKVTEAQSGLYQEGMDVIAAKVVTYSETLVGAGAKYYKAKMNIITLDERTAKESKSATYAFVQADSLDDAKRKVEEAISKYIVDVELEAISETKILDYIA